MEDIKSWIKVAALWVAGVIGNVSEDLTVGKMVLIATLILTVLQAWKVWLDIKWRRHRDRHVR